MIFTQPQESPYDWTFRIFNVPVRVSPWFWAISAMMGWSALQEGFQYLALWIGCVFVSILVHELGHVLTGRLFGTEGHIVLYGFGGLAIGSSNLRDRWQRIAVAFAGPAAGFLFLAAVLLAVLVVAPDLVSAVILRFAVIIKIFLGLQIDLLEIARLPHVAPTLAAKGLQDLLWINCLWGLLNLLPIWPLDGGHISRDFLDGLAPQEGIRFSLIISAATAGMLAVASLLRFGRDEIYLTLFFAILAIGSIQVLQQQQTQRRWAEEHWDYPDRNRDRWDR